jgi:hypothetical protein
MARDQPVTTESNFILDYLNIFDLDKKVLKLHSTLRKAESSVLVQVRTACMGLAKYLYSRHVPGVPSAQCRCGGGEEAPRHMALFFAEMNWTVGTLYGRERERAGRSTTGT